MPNQVPERWLADLRRSLAQLRQIHEVIAPLREFDQKMASGGRYECEGLANNSQAICGANYTIEAFRCLAERHGVDADYVLNSLGGVPDFTPSPAAVAYRSGMKR